MRQIRKRFYREVCAKKKKQKFIQLKTATTSDGQSP